jgi:hypothetical protein
MVRALLWRLASKSESFVGLAVIVITKFILYLWEYATFT